MLISFNILKGRDFRSLAFSRMFTAMALHAQAVIVGWQVYDITKDPWMLGLTGLAEAVPAISCALFSGHFVDTHQPQRILSLAQLVLVINALILFLVGGGIVTAQGHHILPLLFAGIFISGVARSFMMPAAFALMSQTVERAQLPAASGWLNSGFQFAAILGPAAAGLIYGGLGATIAWCLPMALALVAFGFGQSFNPAIKNWRSLNAREPAWQSITNGWNFIWKNRIMLSVMALDMFSVLFGGAVAMLPAFADHVLGVGAEGLGILRAAPALGSMIMALFLALNPMRRISGLRLLWVIAGFGVCIIGFGLSTDFYWSIFFLLASGMFDSVNVITRSTLLQLLTPDEMRGRVSSVSTMFIISSNEIGSFVSGVGATLFGLVPSVVIGGLACLGIVGGTGIFYPPMRRLVVDTGKIQP